MDKLEINRHHMFANICRFSTSYTQVFPENTLGGKTCVILNGVITTLDDFASKIVSTDGTALQNRNDKVILKTGLHDRLVAINCTAKAIAIDNPNLDDKFHMPRGNGDQALLNAARAFARDAAPLADEFIAHDMPADFIANLNSDIEKFQHYFDKHNANTEDRTVGSVVISKAVHLGMDCVTRLDAIVKNKFGHDEEIMAAWEIAKHVDHVPRPRKPKSTESADPQSDTPTDKDEKK